jgi:SAM-dependent methyltransferase
MSQTLYTKEQIQATYADPVFASEYIDRRFASELGLLLHDRQVSVVNRIIEEAQPKRILEIAPGPGRITRDVRPTGKFVCLEFNEAMITLGRTACRADIGWVRGDGFRLPFAQAYDFVYSFRFVRHFRRPDREQLYAGLRQALKPGGYFVMDAVNEKVSKPLRDAHPEEYPIYDKLYRPDELRKELSGAGLEPVELLPVHKLFRWQYRSQILLGPRADWINRLVIRALERLPKAQGLEWIVTCRRA